MQRQGQFLQSDYFNNIGGLNTNDSPFIIKDTEANDGKNFDYIKTGALQKRLGHSKINSSADTQLKTFGLGTINSTESAITLIRAAGRKLQSFTTQGSFTDLTEDTTTATSDFLAASNTALVATDSFNTSNSNVCWLSGGGMDQIYGAYSSSKVTANGVPVPTGSISTSASGSGSTLATGDYYYAVAFRKSSTQATSNAALDDVVSVTSGQEVTIDLSSLSSVDTTKYDKIYIYRSAVGGTTGFTTGDLAAIVDSSVTSYDDNGSAVSSSINIPRAGNTVLDNSVLPTATYNFTAVFKRRMVTASKSTVYISDLNKPESWPLINIFTIPSGGEITGLGVIGFNTPTTSALDELLVVYKKNEMWVITGDGTISSGIPDWSLKFIDNIGCESHNSIVRANGFLFWVAAQGIFMWDGSAKPIWISEKINSLFEFDGDIQISKLNLSWGQFFRKDNYIVWYLSHKIEGEQQYSLKLDLRLTLPNASQSLGERLVPGVFISDTFEEGIYAGLTYLPQNADEIFYFGDDTGFIYNAFTTTNDASNGIDFEYETPFLDQGKPGTSKHFHKVILWVESIGDWDITLDYWTDYRSAEGNKSTIKQSIDGAADNSIALWDVAVWDVAFWDDFVAELKPIVFYLSSTDNNTEGDCIKLKFSQSDADSPLTIYGYSIQYSVIGDTNYAS